MEISRVSLDSINANLQNGAVRTTSSEVNDFLVKDLTNTIQYQDEVFVCADYAIRLASNAREQKYQMGVLYLWGFYTETHEPWSHALNQIVTTEGLVVIEPQNDMWWYASQHEIRVGEDFLFWYFNPPCKVHIERIESFTLP